jgi:hypothetical protein
MRNNIQFNIKGNFIEKEYFYKDKSGNISKLPFDDKELSRVPISLFIDYTPTIDELKVNPFNILMIMEPNEYFGLHNYAIQNSYLFSCILT